MKRWTKLYGKHIGICILIAIAALAVNTKINLKKAHIYTVSEPIYTLLKEITSVKKEKENFIFQGWGFDINYYEKKSKCELILQDTETGEALWPKMKKSTPLVEIEERYTGGEDYSSAGFEGRIKADSFKENRVYEILLRYTSGYKDENGKKQKYIRTVTTDEFFYQGEVTEYNPKIFRAPEIAGTDLEKELRGTRLFHYFPEGMWIYYDEKRVFYIIEKEYMKTIPLFAFPINWSVRNIEDLPESRKEYGFGNMSFEVDENVRNYDQIEEYMVWYGDFLPEKAISMSTGIYDNASLEWILYWRAQVRKVSTE